MTASTLDDLKTAWQMLDRKLERQHTLALHQFKETKLAKLRGGFRPLVTGQTIQAIIGLLLALFAGGFWFDHIGTPHLMIYGLLLHAFALIMMVFAIRDLFLIHAIDYGAPVLAIQKQLAALQAWRLRAGVWFAVAGCLIWVPGLLIVFYLMGADLWVHKPEVVYWNIASSFVCLGIAYGVVWWSRRPGQERLAKYLHDSSVGKRIYRAQEMLAEIERFERDGGSSQK
jgi:serine/threonine-protein kinase